MSFSVPIKKEVIEPKDDDKKGKKKVLTYSLRFIDSAKHMARGLSTLVDNLSELTVCKCGPNDSKDIITKGKELKGKDYVLIKCNTCNFKKKVKANILINRFPSTFKLCKGNLKKFLLLLRKGVYPYEYMDSMDKFNETELPSIDKFYSKLQKKHISDKDYAHAKKVWNVFGMKTLGDYHDLYVQVDTAQLSDVFESFRSTCLKVYNLDPAYFVSTPSLAFQAMLKVTKAEIETFTDIDMILMTEKGIRGGLTQVVKKHAVANNKYLHDYDNAKESVFVQYLDANNLYGFAMGKKLPLNGYKWVDISMITEEFIKNYDEEGDTGYLLEVDVEYPKELAGAHRDLPFLAERRYKLIKKFKHEVTKEVEKAHKRVYKQFNITHEPENKLIATVQDKDKYVVNISTLQQALKHGLKLKKVHRAIRFYQSNWLKVYIDKNTELRKEAKNEFEKDFFKLMNNAVFAKMIENVRKRSDIKLIVSEERRKKLALEPNYKGYYYFFR